MQTVFLGYQAWGSVTLRALIESRHTVSLVLTHPGSVHPYESIWPNEVTQLAADHGIPCIERRQAGDQDIVDALQELRPDVLVASNWRTWVSPEVYSIPRHGCLNLHDGLLPAYGGFAPLNWALVNNEKEVGVTVHFMNEEFDLGDIVVQRRVPVSFEDTATDLFNRTLPLFGDLALEALDAIETGTVQRIRQSREQATFYHKRTVQDGLIDWSRPVLDSYNLIRAQADPYPNAYTWHQGKRLRIKKASLPDRNYCGTPGRVFCRVPNGVVIVGGRGDGLNQGLVVEWVEPEDGVALPANDYFKQMGEHLGATARAEGS